MSLRLPEPGLHILPVALISLDVNLVEGSIDGDGLKLSKSLPVGFLGGMKVLSDGVRTGIPEPNFLDHVIADTVVGEREGDVEDGVEVRDVTKAMHDILNSCDDGNFQVIPGENLWRLIDDSVLM